MLNKLTHHHFSPFPLAVESEFQESHSQPRYHGADLAVPKWCHVLLDSLANLSYIPLISILFKSLPKLNSHEKSLTLFES